MFVVLTNNAGEWSGMSRNIPYYYHQSSLVFLSLGYSLVCSLPDTYQGKREGRVKRWGGGGVF